MNLQNDYVKKNPTPDTDFLKENLITETIVSSLTSLDNKCRLPCATEYYPKEGKTAQSRQNKDKKVVCGNCRAKGNVSHYPALRACSRCLDTGAKCLKRAIFALSADCDTGNNGAFGMIRKSLDDGNIDPYLSLLVILPDCPLVAKSFAIGSSSSTL